MNHNSNQRCGCLCRPQIPTPPCMNTDCSCKDTSFPPPGPQASMPPNACRPNFRPAPPTPCAMPQIPAPQPQAAASAMQPGTPVTPPGTSVIQPRMTQTSQNASGSPAPSCGCNTERPLFPNGNPAQMPIAMAYVPWQMWGQTYPMEQGFVRGTIFPELDLPFMMGRCR